LEKSVVLIGYVVAAADQKHRKLRMGLADKIPNFKAIHTRDPNIDDKQVQFRQVAGEQRSCREEGARHVAGGFEKVL